MALTKVTKHIVYGSVMVAHYGRDLSNKTINSTSYEEWGESVTITPQYSDSHLEIILTGSMFTGNDTTTTSYSNLKFRVNGSDEYFLRGILGNAQNQSGAHNHQNQRFGENNGRQNFQFNNYGSTIYACHIHAPGTTNAQTIQVWVSVDNTSKSFTCSDGFLTVSEIAGEHYNLT